MRARFIDVIKNLNSRTETTTNLVDSKSFEAAHTDLIQKDPNEILEIIIECIGSTIWNQDIILEDTKAARYRTLLLLSKIIEQITKERSDYDNSEINEKFHSLRVLVLCEAMKSPEKEIRYKAACCLNEFETTFGSDTPEPILKKDFKFVTVLQFADEIKNINKKRKYFYKLCQNNIQTFKIPLLVKALIVTNSLIMMGCWVGTVAAFITFNWPLFLGCGAGLLITYANVGLYETKYKKMFQEHCTANKIISKNANQSTNPDYDVTCSFVDIYGQTTITSADSLSSSDIAPNADVRSTGVSPSIVVHNNNVNNIPPDAEIGSENSDTDSRNTKGPRK